VSVLNIFHIFEVETDLQAGANHGYEVNQSDNKLRQK